MVKIDSQGNEQIANALLDQAMENIRQSVKNNQPVFLVYGYEIISAGNIVDLISKIGVGVENIFTEVQENLGVAAANALFDIFIRALKDVRDKNSRG